MIAGNIMAFEEEQGIAWLKASGNVPPLEIPASAVAWKAQRANIRALLRKMMGDLPPREAKPAATIVSREDKGDYFLKIRVRQRCG